MYYNFARIHQSLRVTPATAAGVSDHVWSLEENCGAVEVADMDVYGNHLQDISDVLHRAGLITSVRGEGTARFVYAEHANRAVEVYWNGDGFTVELFERPAEVSLRDYQQDTPRIAAEQAVEWLLRRDGTG